MSSNVLKNVLKKNFLKTPWNDLKKGLGEKSLENRLEKRLKEIFFKNILKCLEENIPYYLTAKENMICRGALKVFSGPHGF